MGKRKIKLNTIDKLPLEYELKVVDSGGKVIWAHGGNELKTFEKDQEHISFYKNKGNFVQVKSKGDIRTYPLDNDFNVMKALKGE